MDPQLSYSWAWALEIKGPATLRVSTTDLMEKAGLTMPEAPTPAAKAEPSNDV